MKQGDLVTIATSGDYCQPRPALIVQSDLQAKPSHRAAAARHGKLWLMNDMPQPPDPDPSLARPHVAIAPGLRDQNPVVVRADDDTDADYAARARLLAVALAVGGVPDYPVLRGYADRGHT